MKNKIIIILLSLVLLSCGKINRESIVDKSKLIGMDYRLFQNSPAWELAKAVWDEDIDKINEITSKDKKIINYQDSVYGETLLMLTVMNRQYDSFEALIKNGADVNIHDNDDGSSALIQACHFYLNDIRYVELLLKNGANVNDIEVGKRKEGNTTRFTPLMAASQSAGKEVVELLIKYGADVNYKNEYKQTALSRATMQDKYEIVLVLLKNGADYNYPIFYRYSEKRYLNLIDVLRESVIDMDTKNYKYKMEVVSFLRSKGIEYNNVPIPEYIKKSIKENYPNSWQEYLQKY